MLPMRDQAVHWYKLSNSSFMHAMQHFSTVTSRLVNVVTGWSKLVRETKRAANWTGVTHSFMSLHGLHGNKRPNNLHVSLQPHLPHFLKRHLGQLTTSPVYFELRVGSHPRPHLLHCACKVISGSIRANGPDGAKFCGRKEGRKGREKQPIQPPYFSIRYEAIIHLTIYTNDSYKQARKDHCYLAAHF
jgi:hypothetical protein